MWAGSLRSELYRNRSDRVARAHRSTRDTFYRASLSSRAKCANRSVKSIVTRTAFALPAAAENLARHPRRRYPQRRGLPGCCTISRGSIRPSDFSPNRKRADSRSASASANTRYLLHARLGAALARELFGVEDREVLSAIEKHTTGGERDVAARLRRLFGRLARAESQISRARRAVGSRAARSAGATRKTMRLSALHQAKKLAKEGGPIHELIDVVRESALDKKGEVFTALDVGGRTILADTFAIVTGRSKIQTRAIADAVMEAANAKVTPFRASRDTPRDRGSHRSRKRDRPRLHAGAAHVLQFGTLVGIRHPSTTPSRRVGVTREA